MRNFAELIEEYKKAARYEIGLSKTSIKKYCSYLRRFDRWLKEQGKEASLDDFTFDNLREYMRQLSEERNLRPRTAGAYIAGARAFNRWAVGEGLLPEDYYPAMKLKKPKLDAPDRIYVSIEEARAMLIGADRLKDPIRCKMAKAVLYVFFYCSVRRGELLDLKLPPNAGTHPERAYPDKILHVHRTKSREPRDVVMPDFCHAALIEWLKVRPSTCKHDYLFSHDRLYGYRRLGNVGLSSLLKEVLAAADMRDNPNAKPHAMRRLSAAMKDASGYSLEAIRLDLGHANVKQTQEYLGQVTQFRKNLAKSLPNILAPTEREEAELASQAAPGESEHPARHPFPTDREALRQLHRRAAWRRDRP